MGNWLYPGSQGTLHPVFQPGSYLIDAGLAADPGGCGNHFHRSVVTQMAGCNPIGARYTGEAGLVCPYPPPTLQRDGPGADGSYPVDTHPYHIGCLPIGGALVMLQARLEELDLVARLPAYKKYTGEGPRVDPMLTL